jgi:hypothetical protein
VSDETTATTATAEVSEATTTETAPVAGTVVETPKAPEAKADEQTASADAKATTTGPPEKYEFKAPEGFEDRLTPAALEAVAKEARALGLSQEDAQAYLNATAEHAKVEETASADAWKKTNENWVSEIKADPKIGGTNYERAQSRFNAVNAKYGDESTKELFAQIGNHPGLFRMLAGIGADLEPDTFVKATNPVAPTSGPRTMYVNSPELK